MQQANDYSSPYYQSYPSPPPPLSNPIDHYPPPPSSAPPSYASAPPYAAAPPPPDYSPYTPNYPQFPHISDPPPPPAPTHYTPPPPEPHLHYNPPPPPEPHLHYNPPPPSEPHLHYNPPPPPDPHLHYNPPPPPPPPQQPSPPQFQAAPYHPPYESHQSAPNYPNYPNPNPDQYDKLYGNPAKYDYGSGYYEEKLSGYGSFGPSRPNLGGGSGYDHVSSFKDDGVYAYEGRKEPYGARGTASSKSSNNWSGLFDDYGRAISFPGSKDREREKSGGGSGSGSGSLKVVRAVPKAEEKTDIKSGVQKFRVKLLPESGGQSVMDVLCMVGLDGIRMLDPNTSRTLRIYPLETVTRCDKIDSSTFAFWSKTSVDVDPRRIRLQSNSYTTNTILDTVTAATVQFKEMGGPSRPAELPKPLDQPGDKKKGLTDWITKLKPVNEEKDHWVPDEAVTKCTGCGSDFGAFNRRHHCRNCGDIFCDKCTQGRTPLTADEDAQPVRVCDRCMAEVTHRLSKAKEAASRPVTLQSHEDLARKLQEEMEKNLRISSSGSKSGNSGRRMKEVACPTCTVHLQVQVPSSGSETIECGVCQHPFLVSAH